MSALPAIRSTGTVKSSTGTVNSSISTVKSNAALATPTASKQKVTNRARTPLAVVPSPSRKRRLPLAVSIMLILVAAMATVLSVNISVSSSQYQLVDLKAQRDTLIESNQSLTQQADNYAAPSNLYQEAAQLGMTVATSVGSIDLGTGGVTGAPAPAEKVDPLRSLMGAPAVIMDGTKPESPSTEETAPTETEAAPTEVNTEEANPVTEETPDEAPAPSVPPAPDLNGGSIPAPNQR